MRDEEPVEAPRKEGKGRELNPHYVAYAEPENEEEATATLEFAIGRELPLYRLFKSRTYNLETSSYEYQIWAVPRVWAEQFLFNNAHTGTLIEEVKL